ncbi:hypothetical protein [Butyricicoccus sp.]
MYPIWRGTTPTQNAAFLAALSTKSAKAETTDEIGAYVKSMKDAL